MKFIVKQEPVIIPNDVKITTKARSVTVTGPRGSLTKSYKHIKAELSVGETIDYTTKKNVSCIWVRTYMQTYKQAAIVNTLATLIRNMITGVTKGYRYKMHIVKKHFPIEVNHNTASNSIEIGRFLGGKDLKVIKLLEGVKFSKNEKNNQELWFEGNDLETVSLTCAHVFQSCKAKDKDTRMFIDGIYVSEKGNIVKE